MGRRRITIRSRRGFTLVELIVALLVVDVAVLALVGSSTVLARELAIAAVRARAQAVATARLERLASAPCAMAAGGDTSWGRVMRESWTVEQEPGGTLAIVDSVGYLTTGNAFRAVVLRTRVAC